MFRLLSQESADDVIQVFGGIEIEKDWLSESPSENKAFQSLQSAIAAADAASHYTCRLKARRSRVNSRWRDALVQVTEVMELLLASPMELKEKQHPSSSRNLIPTLGTSKDDDPKTTIFRKLCLSRARVLRQVGLWPEVRKPLVTPQLTEVGIF